MRRPKGLCGGPRTRGLAVLVRLPAHRRVAGNLTRDLTGNLACNLICAARARRSRRLRAYERRHRIGARPVVENALMARERLVGLGDAKQHVAIRTLLTLRLAENITREFLEVFLLLT